MELVGHNCNKKNSNKNHIFMRALFCEPGPPSGLRLSTADAATQNAEEKPHSRNNCLRHATLSLFKNGLVEEYSPHGRCLAATLSSALWHALDA
ncbi:MAG: hypothetical protein U1F83_03770 [Verrucomicrobiota bacterium]